VEGLINRNLIDVAHNRVITGSDGKDGGRNWEEIG
jgi:hypothetical protein